MKRNDLFTRLLAIGGTVLIWLPLLLPVLLAIMAYFSSGAWLFDYLMPAELFPLAIAGAALLLWAALRAHDRLWLMAAAAGAALISLALLLISPGAMPGTWMMAVLYALLAVYIVGLGAAGVAGALLIHDLFRRAAPRAAA